MEITNETVVICRFCLKPMQIAEQIKSDKGRILAQRYICGCQSPPFHHNIHAGDKTKEAH